MACSCNKGKNGVNKAVTTSRPTRPLNQGGRTRRLDKRVIR